MEKQILSEIKFALENGFTNVETGINEDGSRFIIGSFGYFETSDIDFYLEITKLVNSYLNKDNVDSLKHLNLTKKEKIIFELLIENTFEYGLPVLVEDIYEDAGMTKKQVVGVVSSLYKKGILKEYLEEQDTDMFILKEEYVLY